ncbi:branched-chain amino acid ABC transporter substrate-binding protein [Rubellimicrobium rubrum]|uniref:Branched-chain amino acid ABC transporter substrate-binding protein n=1 Tax=Rubellimicrobium rubrum TaxID=2585369 RepID=A0A5C4MPT0_9RHOB|nr:ABC transporter substrate-binding protein [Rubellimicrobium rubrum]TNC46943.1 branched-chain amino acid ABC transporter substrate-binding protein [Rubellimicrobium rubrum]
MLRPVAALCLFGILAGLPANAQNVAAAVLRVDYPSLLPISRLDLPTEDLGFAGAVLATEDNQTTGQFLGQEYETRTVSATPEEARSTFDQLIADGYRIIIVMARHDDLLGFADAAPGGTLILNARATDESLRSEDCRANVLHVAPSEQMLTDALAQFLVWKRWDRWLVIHGSHPEDLSLAAAYEASAAKFGARIVETREFTDTGGARATDSGHVLVQRQIPVFTQGASRHSVVVAADANDIFAPYLPFQTWDAAPVTGSAGLRPVTWHPAHEAWGATQMQNRFEELAGRPMREEDYQAWLALRVVGEAVTRTQSADPDALRDYMLGPDFEVAAFKGQPLTFRDWNGELRQPILLTDGRITVSVSPQEGFLHQVSPLDTLGLDRPESKCTAFGEESG